MFKADVPTIDIGTELVQIANDTIISFNLTKANEAIQKCLST